MKKYQYKENEIEDLTGISFAKKQCDSCKNDSVATCDFNVNLIHMAFVGCGRQFCERHGSHKYKNRHCQKCDEKYDRFLKQKKKQDMDIFTFVLLVLIIVGAAVYFALQLRLEPVQWTKILTQEEFNQEVQRLQDIISAPADSPYNRTVRNQAILDLKELQTNPNNKELYEQYNKTMEEQEKNNTVAPLTNRFGKIFCPKYYYQLFGVCLQVECEAGWEIDESGLKCNKICDEPLYTVHHSGKFCMLQSQNYCNGTYIGRIQVAEESMNVTSLVSERNCTWNSTAFKILSYKMSKKPPKDYRFIFVDELFVSKQLLNQTTTSLVQESITAVHLVNGWIWWDGYNWRVQRDCGKSQTNIGRVMIVSECYPLLA